MAPCRHSSDGIGIIMSFSIKMQNPLNAVIGWKTPAVAAQHPTITEQRFYLATLQPSRRWSACGGAI